MDKKKIIELLVALQRVTPETMPLIKEDEELCKIWNLYKGDVVYFYSILSPVCKDKFVEQLLEIVNRLFNDNNNKPNENK